MSKQRFASVWDAIEDTPEEAKNMRLRSSLMTALKSHITRVEVSQAQAARLFGVTQPRVSDLMRGKINLFGLDALVNMTTAAGLHVEMRVLEGSDTRSQRDLTKSSLGENRFKPGTCSDAFPRKAERA